MPISSVNSGLPNYPAGLSDKEAALLVPVYRALNGLAQQISDLTGVTAYTGLELATARPTQALVGARSNRLIVRAGTDLPYGTAVTLQASGPGFIATKASSAATTTPCHGIVDTISGIANTDYGEIVFMTGLCPGVSGTVFGALYYLSLNGLVQTPAPAGPLVQLVGVGMGTYGIYLTVEPKGL